MTAQEHAQAMHGKEQMEAMLATMWEGMKETEHEVIRRSIAKLAAGQDSHTFGTVMIGLLAGYGLMTLKLNGSIE